MQTPPKSPIARHYLVRILQTAEGRLYGQLSEPASGWKQTFHSLEELAQLLEQHQRERSIGGEEAPQP